jgi:hypothetical protein
MLSNWLDPDPAPRPRRSFRAWAYREDVVLSGADLVDYQVETTDGAIGTVDEASNEVDASYLVVDVGPWIFGRRVMIPAGTINHVDHDERRVYVDRSRDQIQSAPEFDPDSYTSPTYHEQVGGYYGGTYDDLDSWDGAPPGSVVPGG